MNNIDNMNNNIERSTSPDYAPEIPPEYVDILPKIDEQPQQPYDEDEHSGEIREYNGVFEGPEKTLGEIICIVLFLRQSYLSFNQQVFSNHHYCA